MRQMRSGAVIWCALLWLGVSASYAQYSIPLETAKQYFEEAHAICTADNGQLWGVSLCGPMLFVDPDARMVVANQADKSGMLRAQDGVFVGLLPKEETFANTATDWAGVYWTEMMWPLPAETESRHVLMAHEMYHRIQGQITKPTGGNAGNAHLDALAGRYFLQLEWNALSKALKESVREKRDDALRDSLLFRAERYKHYPAAEKEESSLEMNEGLAEYTGVVLGNQSAADRVKAALQDIETHRKDKTYVRSFAYATGPAYGLLLDVLRPEWKDGIRTGKTLWTSAQESIDFKVPVSLDAVVGNLAKQYDGAAIHAAEQERDRKRQAVIAAYRATFIDGATLTLPFRHMQVQFDPRNLQPLDDAGTIYPTIRITDDWGVLEANHGALMKPDWSAVVVSAPTNPAGGLVKGDGWTLDLKPGWEILAGARKGDYILAAAN